MRTEFSKASEDQEAFPDSREAEGETGGWCWPRSTQSRPKHRPQIECVKVLQRNCRLDSAACLDAQQGADEMCSDAIIT